MNQLGKQASFHIGEASEIAAVRRAGNDLARKLGFTELRSGQLAIVITEAATNIVKHAREGEILLRPVACASRSGVEVLAIDRGPGMGNVALRMEDGNSTSGTYGVGMGAIRRLAQEFDIYSVEGQGTVLMMVVWDDGVGPKAGQWQIGAVCLPLAGEDECGDAFAVGQDRSGVMICAADGLGHGPDAATASAPAVALAASHPGLSPSALMEMAHAALRGTRGAALAVASIDTDRQQLTFAGVGNIAGYVFQDETRRHLLSHNGIVGSNLRKVQEFVHPWLPGAMLVLHSDGIATRWEIDAYPGLAFRHPALVAAILYRDFARERDDSMVLVACQRSGS